MKQKYLLEKQEDNGLVIKEFGELEEGIFSLLCEESFDAEGLKDSLELNDKELIAFLRTDNMFPPSSYTEKIAAAVRNLFSETSSEEYTEIVFDEIDIVATALDDEDGIIDSKEEDLIDDLLEGSDDDFDPLEDDLSEIEVSPASPSAPVKADKDTAPDDDL